ncbi:MAG: hypothetical protein EBV32_04295 [Proteobacteria bacterium]|uniref:biotin carboxylase n=1 Tax=Candidatus Fonsibacter lacus TaxID=2576439 RepID=A0A964XS21_9PROT|nr:hypothetical protein [Candidatus Fonsibacter lacus]
MIKKILIANRGEIAVRVIRACKELEIATVAVHSTADNESMHVRLADESICIGSQKAQDSYLNIPSLISAIEITGADAVHPGYGFLSENYKFAEILEQHKIKFIGPSSELIRKMGDKIEAKKIAKSLGDCSVQRRYQKIIEESPCPVINDEQRKYLLDVSVNAISKLGYEGAGTLEFIYDKGKFYFLEMNTRLQVEHPVTEEVTGIDLVKRQIEIASTGKLSLQQKDITFFGHAIECRINAEDPSKDFLPSAGTIKTYNQPSGPGTRVDSCVFQGCKIPPYYDSLVAKLICHGRDRSSAISRLKRSLDEFVIEGVSTTIDLHKKILRNEDFINSKYDVNWLSKTKFY